MAGFLGMCPHKPIICAGLRVLNRRGQGGGTPDFTGWQPVPPALGGGEETPQTRGVQQPQIFRPPLQLRRLPDHFQKGLGGQPGGVVARQGAHPHREQPFPFPGGSRPRGQDAPRRQVRATGNRGGHGGGVVGLVRPRQAGLLRVGRALRPPGRVVGRIGLGRLMHCDITSREAACQTKKPIGRKEAQKAQPGRAGTKGTNHR